MQASKRHIIVFTLGALILFALGCGRTRLDKEAYLKWMKEETNPLRKVKNIGVYTYEVLYTPAGYLVAGDLLTQAIAPETADQAYKEKSNMHYFRIRLSVKEAKQDILKYNLSSQEEYYNRLYYYSYTFAESIKLLQCGKETDCELFHFEKTYDLQGARTFMLGFPKNPACQSEEEITISIDSKIINAGPVKINYSVQEMKNIPELAI